MQANIKVAWDYCNVDHMGACTLSSQLVLGGIFSPGLDVGASANNIAADYMEPQIATREWLLDLMRETGQIAGRWSEMYGLAAYTELDGSTNRLIHTLFDCVGGEGRMCQTPDRAIRQWS